MSYFNEDTIQRFKRIMYDEDKTQSEFSFKNDYPVRKDFNKEEFSKDFKKQ